ncbi:imidazoleglycerol-phosphate dehydratase [Halobacteriales archaeon QS_1_67_19]|nr:MAG: imidazoleglycerol-phosphate dehydratase [Halobacteriales archaeon QS_1_67_19]
MSDRTAAVTRETAETDIEVTLDVDGDGEATVETGVGFFDHMLESFAKHGLFDLTVRCDGDLEIDDHHTVEDVAITLGEALAEALGDKRGIERFADRRVPLDEAVASVVVDVSGLHVEVAGENAHHEIEALFKAAARALDDATRIDERRSDVASTKGQL